MQLHAMCIASMISGRYSQTRAGCSMHIYAGSSSLCVVCLSFALPRQEHAVMSAALLLVLHAASAQQAY